MSGDSIACWSSGSTVDGLADMRDMSYVPLPLVTSVCGFRCCRPADCSTQLQRICLAISKKICQVAVLRSIWCVARTRIHNGLNVRSVTTDLNTRVTAYFAPPTAVCCSASCTPVPLTGWHIAASRVDCRNGGAL